MSWQLNIIKYFLIEYLNKFNDNGKRNDFFQGLTPRQEKILRMRLGIGESKVHTFLEIAESFDLSRERIRQIEYHAIRKLCHQIEEANA